MQNLGFILLDLNLPKIDGLDVCAVSAPTRRRDSFRLLFFTLVQEQEDVAAGYSCGANVYVRKPLYDFAEAAHSLSALSAILSELPPGPQFPLELDAEGAWPIRWPVISRLPPQRGPSQVRKQSW